MLTCVNIGILTSGGDCPGLNAVIRGAVMKGDRIYGVSFLGVHGGFGGFVDDDVRPLSRHEVRGLSRVGGTILGTSRRTPFADGAEAGAARVKEVMRRHDMDALITIGGEGTLHVARMLFDAGVRTIGVPKTIDNDLEATDYTFGFDTAVSIATESMDRLRTTGESHKRCMVVEVMGRHAGWIALHSGLAAGAHAILIPEQPVAMEQIYEWVHSAADRGRAPLVVVAEGWSPGEENITRDSVDGFGRPRLGGVGEHLGALIEAETGIETRVTTLGHLQRGGVPTAYDRVLATRFGLAAIDAAMDGKWGHMVALRGTEIETVRLADATDAIKQVPQDRWDEAAVLFG